MINIRFKNFYVKITYAVHSDDYSAIKSYHYPKPEETAGEEGRKMYFCFEDYIISPLDKFVKTGVWN